MTLFFTAVGIYLFAVNLWGFILMGIDKRRAERSMWRISEFALFIPAFFGGALGCICGMQLFRHKTEHIKFTLGMPIILIIQLAIVGWIVFLSPWSISFM